MSCGKMQVAVVVCLGLAVAPATTRGQQREPLTRRDAALIVEGTVREVFQSLRREQIDELVQIEVRRSELGQTPRDPGRVFAPAPGEAVYVHTSRPPGPPGESAVPAERAQVRVYLVARPGGGWAGAGTGAGWYETTSNELAAASPSDPPPAVVVPRTGPAPTPSPSPSPAPAGKVSVPALGMTGEALNVQGRFVFRVTRTEQGGPAQRAGLEPGDAIVGANNKELAGLDQLNELARQGRELSLIVLDVNSGKAAQVSVELAAETAPPAGGPARPEAAPAPANPPKRSLGFAAEPVRMGERTGMKVTRVVPDGLAAKAGLEPGDVIVAVNGVPVTNVETMSSALHKAGPNPQLIVRDTRTGKDTPVTVRTVGDADRPGAAPAPAPAPVPADPKLPQGGGRRLGVVGEVVFLDTDSAVKVTEVEPNSPAARAGIEPGDVITEANGTPVLHPNTLNEVVSKSGASLRLIVVDPRSGKRTNVDVNLGG